MDPQYPTSGLCPDLQVPSNTNSSMDTIRVSTNPYSSVSSPRTSQLATKQTCHRTSQRHQESGILLQRIPSREEEWDLETSNKLTCSQPVLRDTNLFNGISKQSSCGYQPRRVGNFSGFNRRLFPRPDCPTLQQIPAFCHKQQGISVHGSPVRTIDGATSLYENASDTSSTFPHTGHTLSSVHRRHPNTSVVSSTSTTVDRNSYQSSNQDGIPHKHHQIDVRSGTTICVHRSEVSNGSGSDDTTRRSFHQDCGNRCRAPSSEPSPCHPLAIPTRGHRVSGKASSPGKTVHTASTDLLTTSVQDRSTSSDTTHSSRCSSIRSFVLVDRQNQRLSGTDSRPLQPSLNPLHGCKPSILGRSLRRRRFQSERFLDSRGVSDEHQPTRVASCPTSPTEGATIMGQQTHPSGVRQHDNDFLHQQVRRYEICRSPESDVGPVSTDPAEFSTAQGTSYSRETQQTGRFTFENQPSSRHGVDDVPTHPPLCLGPLGNTEHRPHGNISHETVTSVHFAIPGPASPCSRRNILQLGRDGRVCVSSMANDCSSSEQTTTRELCSNSNHPVVAKSSLVPCTIGVTNRQSTSITSLTKPDYHASQPLSARQSSGFTSTRLQTIFQSATDQGFSQEVSRRIATGQHRGSTQNIYCSRWRAFDSWCSERDYDPRTASVAQLADFLLHLFDSKGLSPSAIAGYRSAINSVWRVIGRSSTESFHLTQLIKSFKADRPRSRVVHPKWDLALVLSMLTKPPYEPLSQAPFKDLAAKTVFLLLLASSRRRGDIHAIDPKRVTFMKDAAILVPCPGYLPKIRSTAEGQTRYQPIVVRSLRALTNDEDELSLCPVRALRLYDTAAKLRAPDRRQFFISSALSAKPVSKNTLSAWTVKLIRKAYTTATDDDIRPYKTSTHEVRAIAASLALQANFSLSNVLGAATWANPTTFTEHYLRDVSGLQGKLHIIAPCVVAGVTLH